MFPAASSLSNRHDWQVPTGQLAPTVSVSRFGRNAWFVGMLLLCLSWHSRSATFAQELPPAAAPAPPTAKAATETKANNARISLTNPQEILEKGGPFIWPILLCSLVSLTFALERLVSLRRGRVIPYFWLRRFLKQIREREMDRAKAMEACRRNGSPMALILLAIVRYWGRPTRELQQAVSEAGQSQIARLRRNLRALQGAANLATLLGLLGTIVGMIEAFNQVAESSQAQGRAEMLAGGIAQALLTTAAGLIVAIPSLFFYTYFAGRVERLVSEMDEMAMEVIDLVSLEAMKPNVQTVQLVEEPTAEPVANAKPSRPAKAVRAT